MKIQSYCYTRNEKIDYCDLVSPNLPYSQIDVIRQKILSITRIHNTKFNIPKWILIKMNNIVVWGCCCWNQLLAQENFTDQEGRPAFGFFSIIISDYSSINDISLPFDIEFFKHLYLKEIEPGWRTRERKQGNYTNFISNDFKNIKASYNNYVSELNTDIFKCKSLGNLDKEAVIAAALTLENVSLLIDNDNIEQATDKKGPFMNCLSLSVATGLYTIKQLYPNCKEYVSAFTSSGICPTYQEKEQIDTFRKEEEEEYINKQLEKESNDANIKNQYLENKIEEANKKIKKKEQLIIVLSVVALLLLLALVQTHRNNIINLFDYTNFIRIFIK